MALIAAADAPAFELPGLAVTGLAAPSRGARETCAWRITLHPGADGAPHLVDHEEIFIALEGTARAIVAGTTCDLSPGDALVVPANTAFALANRDGVPFHAVAIVPVGAQARYDE